MIKQYVTPNGGNLVVDLDIGDVGYELKYQTNYPAGHSRDSTRKAFASASTNNLVMMAFGSGTRGVGGTCLKIMGGTSEEEGEVTII
jgi:hypothetical protein